MKSKFVFSSSSLFIGLFLFFFTENVCSQESADNWTLKQARQWTQKQEWANGLKAMPHKTTDYQEFASQYHKNQKVWDKTFQWLATHDLANMPAGRYEVDGEHCYINVQDATTQDVSKRKIEAHRHGIDLQYVVKGTERFGITSAEYAEPITEYKPDVTFYKAKKIKYVDSTPDTFFMCIFNHNPIIFIRSMPCLVIIQAGTPFPLYHVPNISLIFQDVGNRTGIPRLCLCTFLHIEIPCFQIISR